MLLVALPLGKREKIGDVPAELQTRLRENGVGIYLRSTVGQSLGLNCLAEPSCQEKRNERPGPELEQESPRQFVESLIP